MAAQKHSFSSDISQQMRLVFLLILGGLTLVCLVAFFFIKQRAALIIISGAGVTCAVVGWIIIGQVATHLTRDFRGLVTTVRDFNSGNKSVRARAQGPKEIRQLSDGINRIIKENETALSAMKGEDRRQNRFVGDVSHELRTPLASIHGAAETLLEGDVDPEYQQRFLNMIIENTERLTRLANDLIELTKIEGATGEIPLRRFRLRQVVNKALTSLEPTLEARGAEVTVTGDVPEILGAMDRVQQIVVNLVDNASRASEPGGKIQIELSVCGIHELGPQIHDKNLADVERFVLLSIADNGPGISEEDLPHLFERFTRPQQSRARTSGGAGIGLSIVKAIVSSHGGAIDVRNRKEGGALFRVFLPIPPELPRY
ncbi:MAG: HAMP domain-containing histidine kinase [Coriobacteriia bacterium]|nr:HAMP domain-containing histidine kinase [Coriobacteriia bacterium]